MMTSRNREIIQNPTDKQKRRERLSKNDRKRFLKISGKVCEITGNIDPRKRPREPHEIGKRRRGLEIHHSHPVAHGGRKDIPNLVLLDPEVHTLIHSTAHQLCKSNPDLDLAEVTKKLTEDAVALGKMERVLQGEDPEKVYKRELYLQHAAIQRSLFEES